MQITNSFISGGCNQVYQGMAWSKNLIAYVCHNQIFIVNFQKKKVVCTLLAHTKRVQSLIIFQIQSTYYIASVGSDGNLVIYKNTSNLFKQHDWIRHLEQKICKDILLNITSISHEEKHILAITDALGNNNFYIFDETLVYLDTVEFGNKVQQNSAFLKLDTGIFLVAFGGVGSKVHLFELNLSKYPKQSEECQLEYITSLKGHQNEITDLKFQTLKNYSFLASSSQDSYIRLWKIQKQQFSVQGNFEDKNSLKLQINNAPYVISLETILIAHQESITSLSWGFLDHSKEIEEDNLNLISCSFDHNIILWSKQRNIWMNTNRFGQFSGNKNAFFMNLFSECSQYILGYTLVGSFYLWKKNSQNNWVEDFFVGGHYKPVTDLDWSSNQLHLLSASLDQTSRIYCELETNWHEISRPQIHGYDINSIKFLKVGDNICDLIVSAADEKIIRIFEPTAYFINQSNNMTRKNIHLYFSSEEEEQEYIIKNNNNVLEYVTETSAGQQVLGLMVKANKASKEKYSNYHEQEEDDIPEEFMHSFKNPPIEDYIQRITLWPEMNKLYGHGYEMSTISVSHSGKFIASACKSQSQNHSSIFIWDPKTYKILQKIIFHNYTITQLVFSQCDQYLASVSRDRQIAIYKFNDLSQNFEQENKSNPQIFNQVLGLRQHTRIVWSVDFSHDSQFFVTGGRDKKLIIFNINGQVSCQHVFKSPVTAVSYGDKMMGDSYVVAVGLENGLVYVMTVKEDKIKIGCQVEDGWSFGDKINRLMFRKQKDGFCFAGCSDDHTLRVFKF